MIVKRNRSRLLALSVCFAFATALQIGCPVWRTEHKIETTHKIEAHIVIDIRREAAALEDEVRGDAAQAPPKAEPDEQQPQAMAGGVRGERTVASRSVWSIFDVATVASAQSGGDKAKAVARRKQRGAKIDRALTEGCLGENEKGYVQARPCKAPKARKGEIKRMAKNENADRKTIYSAVALEQGLKARQHATIGRLFSDEIRKKLKKGMPFQAPADAARFKEFKASALGKRVAGVKRGGWVKAP